MLQRLVVRNFKLISALDLDFPAGTCAVTGETGAGKSAVVQALEVALGGDMLTDAVRPGSDRGEVQAWFGIRNAPQVKTWLQERDLPLDLDDGCVLRRTFQADGPSRAQINGSACTLAMLGEVGVLLADLVVQHRHLSILQPQTQLAILDSAWDSRITLGEMAGLYRKHRDLKEQMQQLGSQQQTADQRREFLATQLAALDEMDLQEDSLPSWEGEHSRLSRSSDFLQAMDQAEVLLRRGEQSAAGQLSQALRAIPEPIGEDDPVTGIRQSLIAAEELLDEATQEISRQAGDVQNNSHRLAELESLLGRCHESARLHQCEPGELWRLREQWQQELEQLDRLAGQLAELDKEQQQALQDWLQRAATCSAGRNKAAKGICTHVGQLLGELGMRQASFDILLQPHADGTEQNKVEKNGLEKPVFVYSPAPGVPASPLGRIASGGELSRLHLALHLSTADYLSDRAEGKPYTARTGLVVLDEADAGIGGETAQRLAELVRKMGETVQVLCITHLPQLAAAAHHHLRVRKLDGEPPQLQVGFLAGEERTDEVARMLSGDTTGAESRNLAERMLANADMAGD